MLEIPADNFIANYFLHHPEANDVSMRKLRELKSDIERHFWQSKSNVYIWATRDAIFTLLEDEPTTFAWENDQVSLKDRSQALALAERSNAQLDTTIKDTYLELMKTLCQK